MDIVKINQSHPISVKAKELSLSFSDNLLPSGSYDSINIQCESLKNKSDVNYECKRDSSVKMTTCTCPNLIESTEYSVSIFTAKLKYNKQIVNLRNIITSEF